MSVDLAAGHQALSDGRTAKASTALDRWALARIQRSVASAPLRFVLWDGFTLPTQASPSVGTIIFRDRRALMQWVWDPELNLGETYMFGTVDIQGDLPAVLMAIYRTWRHRSRRARRPWLRSNDVESAQANVHQHYDIGNDFYRLWLDRQLLYTCAYFPSCEISLEDAQIAKMDLVCRKLRLKPGERVIEVGSGWGALALHMATHYGVTVRAFNVSATQVEYARARAEAQRLGGRVEFVLDDYRRATGRYDAFVSVGMLEHVGLADFEIFGRVISRCLSSHGRGLLHFIGRNQAAALNPWIRKRIFPGAYPPTLGQVSELVLEPQGLSVLDVENLRLHYAKTLELWRQRFLEASDEVRVLFGAAFVRAWDLYLAGSLAAFTTGSMQLFQIVLAPGSSNAVPWTRSAS